MVATAAAVAGTEEAATNSYAPGQNRLGGSLRFGLNIKARFKGTASVVPPGRPTRTTPNGDSYNYDNGYVLPDVGGGGQTWYWGYDDNAAQISGNTILFSRSTPEGSFSSPATDYGAQPGFEITYDRYFYRRKGLNIGLEVAANYLNISIEDRGSFSANVMRTTDAYGYTPGTTPPGATPGNPYQGSFDGPGFLISDTPLTSSTMLMPGGYTVSGSRTVDADLWGGRIGPVLDFSINDQLSVGFSAGLALGALIADASWNETILFGKSSVASAGGGSDSDLLLGWYAGGSISWSFAEHWSAQAGVQFQDLGKYSHNFGGRTVELDLSKSLFVTIGASYSF